MTMALSGVRPGWKVYARAAEVGTVETVDNGDLYFRRGRLIQHRYRVPGEFVESADEGVVDLKLDPDTIEQFAEGG
jgi:hypothetical protein